MIAAGTFYFLMVDDQNHGGHVVWPVYAFAASAVGAGITLGYVAARLTSKYMQ